ncbi:undecaprenyl-diphosphate phosphatase [Ilyobacter sp.]|uniref:undecaprenyl-diphosphate phosphatase n=1 Tax=Ilyobacter sp. TaxID=3100343 RepID=UPI0035625CF5
MSALLVVIILGVVEGLTEFIPVSSTGHMILVEEFINSPQLSKEFMDTFLIVVQLGAILAVVLIFWKDISPFVSNKKEAKEKISLWSKIGVGVLPAAVVGLLLDDYISEYFFGNVVIVAVMLIVYGLLFMKEKSFEKENCIEDIKKLTYKTAFIIGCFQCLAMIPGTSRSGVTIIGGIILGLSRGVAAEYSFFLAIPIMAGATLLKVLKNGLNFSPEEWQLTAVGTAVSFFVAYIVIKWFMYYIKNRDFKIFGVYRIVLGILVLISIF